VDITDDDVKELQAALGPAWFASTATYPEGRRLTAMPWPPRWAPADRLVIGRTVDEVLAGVRERVEEQARIRAGHVDGQDGHAVCRACGKCRKCDPHGPHSNSGPW
jgi:hypothetical protein